MKNRLMLLTVLLGAAVNFLIAQTFPSYTVSVSTPSSSGYYFLSLYNVDERGKGPSLSYHMVLDSMGHPIFTMTRPLTESQVTGNLRLHEGGIMSYYFDGKFYLVGEKFRVYDSVYCRNGVKGDNHELLILPGGKRVLFGVEETIMDLRAYNLFLKKQQPGFATATVIAGVIQEQDPNGNVVFDWRSKDHFAFDDIDTSFLMSPWRIDWTHFNSLDVSSDGNFVVSLRNFNEVVKISRRDGRIIWRLGGKRNQFRFINDSAGFKGQHDARLHANGRLTVYSNGAKHPFLPSSAKEYLINEKDLTAELSWQHNEPLPAACVKGLGNVQLLAGGNVLVNHGICPDREPLFVVLDRGGVKKFEISFQKGFRSYRVYNFAKLPYKFERPEIEMRTKKGKQFLRSKKRHPAYVWSTGATTREIEVSEKGSYHLAIPTGGIGYFVSRPFIY